MVFGCVIPNIVRDLAIGLGQGTLRDFSLLEMTSSLLLFYFYAAKVENPFLALPLSDFF